LDFGNLAENAHSLVEDYKRRLSAKAISDIDRKIEAALLE
jgi:hypothetical protein